VGVDCATQEKRTGLARGRLDERGKVWVDRVTLGTAGESAAATIWSWIEPSTRYVIALDAPLGWPSALGRALSSHQAGVEIATAPDTLFYRHTDHVVRGELHKVPLAVGADRIARTAHAALRLLAQVATLAGKPIPLAWQQGRDVGAIEVYPAATLMSRQLSTVGYKADTIEARKIRQQMLQRLAPEIELTVPNAQDLMMEFTDEFDAVLCVLAGADFVKGLCVEPDKPALAKKEGFIWFRGTGQKALF
jgi:predicted RNase H-like nuclease